jgi:DNA invertase Pin-like site-specific DNA recombinase
VRRIRYGERNGQAQRKMGFVPARLDRQAGPIHILAAVAEHERELISSRTKAALAAAKERGKKLGGPKQALAAKLGAAANKEAADKFAANALPIIRQVQASGVTTLRGIAGALTARGIPTPRGREWSAPQVANVLKRVET